MTQTPVPATQMATLPPDSFLAHVLAGRPLRTTAGRDLIRQVPSTRRHPSTGAFQPTLAVLGCIDNGNDALKLAMPHADAPTLATVRMPTAYTPAREIRGGEGRLTWQVNAGEAFWCGEEALASKKADALPVGFSHERLPQTRFQHVLAAAQVEMLVQAGYGHRDASGHLQEGFQGEIDLYTSFGLPPEEVDRSGATRLAKETLSTHLWQKPFHVTRTDEEGHLTTWTIRFVEILPFGQTFGSFASWYYTLDGTPVQTDIERHVTLDIGGGQFHACEVDLELRAGWSRPKLHMSASQIGVGTVEMARGVSEALRTQYPSIQLSDAQAQRVLSTKTLSVGGRRQNVERLVQEVIISRADTLQTAMLRYLQDGQSFLMFTGGGSVLLFDTLSQLVRSHREAEEYFFVPAAYSAVLNAIGGIVLAQAAARRVLSQQRHETEAKR